MDNPKATGTPAAVMLASNIYTPSKLIKDMLQRKLAADAAARVKEAFSDEIYDTVILTGGATLKKGEDYELFAVPIGEQSKTATNDNAVYKVTRQHTSIRTARRLESGRAFSVHGMYANVTIPGNADTADEELGGAGDPTPGAGRGAVNLLLMLQHAVSFIFVSDDVEHERGKLRRFTSPHGISGFAGTSAINAVANNGFGRGFRLPFPRDIWGNRDFGVKMIVHEDVLIPITTEIEFVLDGFTVRVVG